VKERRYTFSLRELARLFVDYDRIASREWEKKHAGKIASLATHFHMPPGSEVIDTLRTAMEAVLDTGKPLQLRAPDQTRTSKD
jgi:hypothetical protein